MVIRPQYCASLALFALASVGSGQVAPAPTPCPTARQAQTAQGTAPAPCKPSADTSKPSTAQQFPFPGEPARPAAEPSAPASAQPKGSAATEHPFPTTSPPRLPDADSSGSSSSSSGSSSDDPNAAPDSGPPLSGEGSSTHRRLPKVKRVQTDDERVDEDLNVAKFYMGDENFQGAYLRAKEAVKIQPDYSAAHFTLGQVAEKMKKKDEAIVEYKTYLKLDPDGEQAKQAKRALAELQ